MEIFWLFSVDPAMLAQKPGVHTRNRGVAAYNDLSKIMHGVDQIC